MKKILPVFVFLASGIASLAQFSQIVVEEIENEGKVLGRTYRIYAEMQTEGDQLYIVYGDSAHPMNISSTKPFFQSKYGGAFSKDINRKMAAENDSLRYDSWVTIGAVDNYNNSVTPLKADLSAFEEKGGAITCNTDCCWFCLPDNKQAYCGPDKRILLMQLTSEGIISGNFCIMGKNAKGEVYQVCDVTFSCK